MRTFGIRRVVARALTVVLASAVASRADPVGMVESWNLRTGVQNTFGDFDQVFERTLIVQSPFTDTQLAQIGTSVASTYLNVTIDGDNLVMVIQPEHFCEKTSTVRPRCISSGDFFLTPSVDVLLNASGSYTYHLGGDPVTFSSGLSGQDYTNPGDPTLEFSHSHVVHSFLNPSNATLQYDTGGLLLAGRRYRISYAFDSIVTGASPPIGSVVSGQGSIVIEAHPVPEPSALCTAALAAFFVCKPPGRHCRPHDK